MLSHKRLLLTQYLGLVTMGFLASIIGPLLLLIRSELHLTYGQSGLLLSGPFIGVMITVLIGGTWADRYGKKPYLITGGIFMVIGLLGSMLANSYIGLLTLIIIAGIGFGVYEIGMNALCADGSGENKGAAMNLLHVFFGIGAVAGPILATLTMNLTGSWRPAFGIVAILPIIVSCLVLSLFLPRPATKVMPKGHPYRNWFIWLVGLTTFIYIGIESVFFGWLPAYWRILPQSGFIPASITTVIFWLALTIGRLVGSRIIDRVGMSRFMTFSTGATLAMAILWCFFAKNAFGSLGIVFIIGIIIAGIFPTIMASTTAHYPERTAEISAFITFFPGVGGFIMPVGIGSLADQYIEYCNTSLGNDRVIGFNIY